MPQLMRIAGWKAFVFLLLLAMMPALLAQAAAGAPPAAKAKLTYAGSEACQTCHEDQGKWLKGSVHGEAMKQEEEKPQKGWGCESCHGPGSAHVDEPKKENITTFKTESAQQRANACLGCHGKKEGLTDFIRTKHRSRQLACDQCHAAKDSKTFHSMRSLEDLKGRPMTETCQSCHGEVRAAFSMPFRHRVKEGWVACGDCHTEHTGYRSGRRQNAEVNAACGRCHSEKRGPFVYEHPPAVAGGCTSCHTPHGSTNARLLARSNMRTLCLECHTNTPRSHNQNQPKYQNCTVCHKAIHGSNSDRKLFH